MNNRKNVKILIIIVILIAIIVLGGYITQYMQNGFNKINSNANHSSITVTLQDGEKYSIDGMTSKDNSATAIAGEENRKILSKIKSIIYQSYKSE